MGMGMRTRRECLVGMVALGCVSTGAWAKDDGETVSSRPKLIKGTPNKVDFGHGLLIPLGSGAFHILWEGDDRWMAFGHGFGTSSIAAMTQAEGSAIGTMKLLLLTLAFKPDRLARVDGGGWKLKSGDAKDLVAGDLFLPGRPVRPTVDQMSGTTEQDENTGVETQNDGDVHATTYYRVWKKDVTLAYVRKAAILP